MKNGMTEIIHAGEVNPYPNQMVIIDPQAYEGLLAALQDAEFLMRQAGKIPGPMQDSFNRSAADARVAIEKAQV